MNIHRFLDDELRDRAAQYVLGTLSESDARSVRAHLSTCSTCRAEVEALSRVADDLGSIALREPPPQHLWTRLAERIAAPGAPNTSAARSPASARSGAPTPAPIDEVNDRSAAPQAAPVDADEARSRAARVQVWKNWTQSSGSSKRAELTFVPGAAGEWQATSVDGIEARQLFVDAAHDRATFLVRMAAGTSYPAHLHAGPEECFVLEGDLRVGAVTMKAGDYQRAERGSTHGVQSTARGCVLLLVSSLSDEILV